LSDFDNKDCSKNEILRENDAVVSFAALEQAELDTTSSLQRLQAALEELRPDTDKFSHERGDTISSYQEHLEMAAENTAWALTDLEKSIVKAHATLDDLESDREGCQDAHASWKTGLADFETMSKPPRNTIETTLAERKMYNGTPEYSAVLLEKLEQTIVELRPELDELNAGLVACRIHIAGCRGYPIPKTVAHCGAPAVSSSDDGSSVDGSRVMWR
jgi:chromosome segregation ATPase